MRGVFYRSNVMLIMANNENTRIPAKANTSTAIPVLFCFLSIFPLHLIINTDNRIYYYFTMFTHKNQGKKLATCLKKQKGLHKGHCFFKEEEEETSSGL